MINVGSDDQLVNFLVGDVLAELLSDSPEVLGGDEASALVVVKSEDFVNVSARVLVVDALGHEGEPLSKVDGSVAISIEVRDHLEDSVALGFKSERGHGGFEL